MQGFPYALGSLGDICGQTWTGRIGGGYMGRNAATKERAVTLAPRMVKVL